MVIFDIDSSLADSVHRPELERILSKKEHIISWMQNVIGSYHCKIGIVQYIFCNDAYLLGINRQFLDHDYFTDIITFDYSNVNIFDSSCTNTTVQGDIFVSIDTIFTNAKQFSHSFKDELLRVLIHGLLHLIGQKDKTETDAMEMQNKENQALSIINDYNL